MTFITDNIASQGTFNNYFLVVSVLKQAPRYDDLRDTEGVTPGIRNPVPVVLPPVPIKYEADPRAGMDLVDKTHIFCYRLKSNPH